MQKQAHGASGWGNRQEAQALNAKALKPPGVCNPLLRTPTIQLHDILVSCMAVVCTDAVAYDFTTIFC